MPSENSEARKRRESRANQFQDHTVEEFWRRPIEPPSYPGLGGGTTSFGGSPPFTGWGKKIEIPAGEEDPQHTVRGQILEDARNLTEGARNKEYGPPWENHDDIARLWDEWLRIRARYDGCDYEPGEPYCLEAADVAMMMILAKVARLGKSPEHRDSAVDIAAYAGIFHECVLDEEQPDE